LTTHPPSGAFYFPSVSPMACCGVTLVFTFNFLYKPSIELVEIQAEEFDFSICS